MTSQGMSKPNSVTPVLLDLALALKNNKLDPTTMLELDKTAHSLNELYLNKYLELLPKPETDNRWDGQWRNGYNSALEEVKRRLKHG